VLSLGGVLSADGTGNVSADGTLVFRVARGGSP
jgi:hypothetical protein